MIEVCPLLPLDPVEVAPPHQPTLTTPDDGSLPYSGGSGRLHAMAIPPIGPTQIVQLGAAAATLAPVVVRTFADLLKSAAELLAPSSEPAAPAAVSSSRASEKDATAVLKQQIADLLSRFNDRLKKLLRGQDPQGQSAQELEVVIGKDGTIQVPGADASQKADFEHLLAADEMLAALFRQIAAREQLLNAALPPELAASTRLAAVAASPFPV